MNHNELYHFGIKGMKWGVRRNRSQLARARGKTPGDDWSDDARTAHEIKKKSVSQMSNAELKQLNERMQLEQNYSRLNPTKVEKGRQYLMGAATLTGTALTLYNNSDKIAKLGRAGATFVKGAIRR